MREGIGLSQQKVADQIGTPLTQQKLHAYETGAYEPDIAMLKALANFFETTIDYLVGNKASSRKIEPVKEYALNTEEQNLVNRHRALRPNSAKVSLFFLIRWRINNSTSEGSAQKNKYKAVKQSYA